MNLDDIRYSNSIANRIKRYYKQRGLVWPDTDSAMQWVETELAEVYELILARKGGWKRNNPDDHLDFSDVLFEEELGDAIFMLLIVGIGEGVNPLRGMLNKMERKLNET